MRHFGIAAREGVERLGALVEQHGISEESAVVFADDNETWYMEIYSGHQWAAIRFPDDSYAVIGYNDGGGAMPGEERYPPPAAQPESRGGGLGGFFNPFGFPGFGGGGQQRPPSGGPRGLY